MSENEHNDDPAQTDLQRVGAPDPQPDPQLVKRDELPVVARLVVEIRSDGSRTIARGAMEDLTTGQSVAIEAVGNSPFQLAMTLARSMLRAPALARTAARALLPGHKRRSK